MASRYEPEEIQMIIDLRAENKTVSQISEIIDRPYDGVRGKISQLLEQEELTPRKTMPEGYPKEKNYTITRGKITMPTTYRMKPTPTELCRKEFGSRLKERSRGFFLDNRPISFFELCKRAGVELPN